MMANFLNTYEQAIIYLGAGFITLALIIALVYLTRALMGKY